MANFSFIWLILVFYKGNKYILWTRICLFICKISTWLMFLFSQVSLCAQTGQLWQSWEQKSCRFFSLIWLEFSLLFLICGVPGFPHICLHHYRCPLIHAAQHCLSQAPPAWNGSGRVPLPVPDSTLHLLPVTALCRPMFMSGLWDSHMAAFCSDTLRLTGSCFHISTHLGKRCNKASTSGDSHLWKSTEFCPNDSSSGGRGNPAVSGLIGLSKHWG